MKTLHSYIQNLVAHGKYFFSKKNALIDLGITENQFRYQAYRLSKKRSLRRLIHGFYMIVPPEYQALGSLPLPWIIDPLMRYLERNYYIGLLSAASLYGATEQQPMTFQVIVDKALRTIKLPRGTIDFHVKKNCISSAIDHIAVPTGYANISTKEQTVIDLVRYYTVSGGLSNVALVLKELGKECKRSEFEKTIQREETTGSIQRLAYILDLLNYKALARVVEHELSKRNHFFIYLRPDVTEKMGERIARWKVILNDYVELS